MKLSQSDKYRNLLCFLHDRKLRRLALIAFEKLVQAERIKNPVEYQIAIRELDGLNAQYFQISKDSYR